MSVKKHKKEAPGLSYSMRMIQILHLLLAPLRQHHFNTYQHSLHVAQLGKMLAEVLGLSVRESWYVYCAGLAHDLGKLHSSKELLDQEDPLTEAQKLELNQHVVRGVELLTSVEELASLARPVAEHHERMDGKGHPFGLLGSEISLPGRILACADTYDVMTRPRPYNLAPKSASQVRRVFETEAGGQFDPEVAKALLWLLDGDAVTPSANGHGRLSEFATPARNGDDT
jgi:putative nucleotidyltransferase with HDIG domain